MKLMIADDDMQIREGIREGIDWQALGIRQVFTAANGSEALKLYMKNQPEIIITDIRMPGMDGLELFRNIIGRDPLAKVIIISGYSDFEYLKKAIQYGAVDYILKPIKAGSIIKLIKKVKDDIIREKATEEEFNKYKQSHKEKFIRDLFSGRLSDRNIIIESFIQYFHLDIRSTLICIAVEIDGYYNRSDVKYGMESEGLYDFIRNHMHNVLLTPSNGILFQTEESIFIVIYKTLDSSGYSNHFICELNSIIGNLNSELEDKYGLSVSMGISGRGKAEEVYILYGQSLQALEQKLYKGRKSLSFFDETSAPVKYDTLFNIVSSVDEDEIKNCIMKCDLNYLSKIIRENFNHLKQQGCHNRAYIEKFCRDLINLLLKTLKSQCIDVNMFFDGDGGNMDSIPRLETIEGYMEWIEDTYHMMLGKLDDIMGIKNPIVLKAAEYIRINYTADITVPAIAGYVEKTPNYFCHVFKKEMGVSFCNYLNSVRIKKAEVMLKNTNLLVSEIAGKVGYKDLSYFTQVFKKITGYAPTDLRRNNR